MKIKARALLALLIVSSVLLPELVLAARSSEATPDVKLSSALAKTPNETRGQRIFEMQCQQCHQADARGVAAKKIPALAGQQYEYLLKQVVDFLDRERNSDAMHQQLMRSGINNATAIADVVGYVANLPRNPAPQQGAGTALTQGKNVYEGYCASCHGQTGEGIGDLWVPSLRGQHYSYLLEQMQHMAHAQRGNISEDLHRMFMGFATEEFQSVADYLTRWAP